MVGAWVRALVADQQRHSWRTTFTRVVNLLRVILCELLRSPIAKTYSTGAVLSFLEFSSAGVRFPRISNSVSLISRFGIAGLPRPMACPSGNVVRTRIGIFASQLLQSGSVKRHQENTAWNRTCSKFWMSTTTADTQSTGRRAEGVRSNTLCLTWKGTILT